jgi:2-amino-4-hydroxy-6-hydroxymethyldihydropteridine diphosphokinase
MRITLRASSIIFVTTMNTIFLLLGSNLGDRNLFLQQAIQHITNGVGPIIKTSSVYETQSWGKTDSPDYLNQVIQLQTELSAQEVLQKILDIELVMGRIREEKWGSRIIDIDILFYNSVFVNEPGLQIPHPELHKRRFTLEPLAEIAPTFIHPVLNATILQLKNELKDSLVVKKLYF